METANLQMQHYEVADAEGACPVCGGPLILLRESFRCSRCCHCFCESCDDIVPFFSEPST